VGLSDLAAPSLPGGRFFRPSRLELSKEQRDEHIRRYTQLIEQRLQSCPKGTIESARDDKRGHRPKGTVAIVAEDLGLSKKIVRAANNPKPSPEPKAPLPDYDVGTVQFNALMAAWNRAGSEARSRSIQRLARL
jgi:hypothetical protein